MKAKLKIYVVLIIALGLIWAAAANAQLTVLNSNVPPGFCQSGIIQAATLNPGGGASAGGTLTINGITMIVPANSVVQMPANTLKWAELFNKGTKAAPAPNVAPVYDAAIPPPVQASLFILNRTTGLALSDNLNQAKGFSPWLPFNATVIGNIDVKNSLGFGAGAYIVGLILPIDQDLGNAGAGFITYIDYARGRFEVGGILNTPNTGTIIEINDPLGRFGLAHSPDPRWSVDSDNPTILTGNGYPMGLPKVAPPAIDPDRPFTNRPLNPVVGDPNHDPFLQVGAPLQAFFMPASAAPGTTTPDPWKQAPFMVGDYVGWAGILCKLTPAAPLVPFNPALPVSPTNLPLNRQTYISAHTVESDKLAIYTAAGTVAGGAGPCYLSFPIGRSIVGTGGANITVPPNPVLGILGGVIPVVEPKTNISLNGWCTDSTNLIDVYALDLPPGATAPIPRLLGTVLPEPGFAAGKGNKGRFRFDVGKGNFLPPTRNYMAKSRHGQIQLGPQSGLNGAPLTGLLTGQYKAPQFGFQFFDAPPGFPNVPNNLQDFPFLFSGEGAVGPLTPFPPFLP